MGGQGEGEGTVIKFVIEEELGGGGGKAVLIRQTENNQLQDTLW